MSEKNWTPGPWSIEPAWDERCGGTIAIVNRDHPRDDWDVCEVHSTEANAHLIRTAPELYAEMERFLPIIERAEADPELWARLTQGTGIATANAYRAVLAKARGAQ